MRIGLATLMCLHLGSSAATVSAQEPAAVTLDPDAEARELFQSGRDYFAAGEFEVALRYFRESYALSGRPELLFNIGSAADRLRRDDMAVEYYRRFLEEMPDSPRRENVEARITAIEGTAGDDDSSVTEQWWFWTAIGGVVAAGVLVAIVVASGSGAQAIDARDGNVMALSW